MIYLTETAHDETARIPQWYHEWLTCEPCMSKTTDVVLDTNVIYAAQYSRYGASRRVLNEVFNGVLTVHLTVPLMLEYKEVLLRKRDELGLTYSDVIVFLAALGEIAVKHDVHYLWRAQVSDPEDAHVLEAAVAASCPWLVTFNMSDFPEAENMGIHPVTPGDVLTMIT